MFQAGPSESLWQGRNPPRKAKRAEELAENEALAHRAVRSDSPDMPRAVQTVDKMFEPGTTRCGDEEAHLAQPLHNFRVRLMEHDGGRLAFCETTDRMIEALGLRTGQRLDSTHVMSNIAVLTRLGLFCLRSVPWSRGMVWPSGTWRVVKHRGTRTHAGEGRRRLSVCARDVYMVDRFRGTAGRSTDCWRGYWGSSATWASQGRSSRSR